MNFDRRRKDIAAPVQAGQQVTVARRPPGNSAGSSTVECGVAATMAPAGLKLVGEWAQLVARLAWRAVGVGICVSGSSLCVLLLGKSAQPSAHSRSRERNKLQLTVH